ISLKQPPPSAWDAPELELSPPGASERAPDFGHPLLGRQPTQFRKEALRRTTRAAVVRSPIARPPEGVLRVVQRLLVHPRLVEKQKPSRGWRKSPCHWSNYGP